MSGKHGRGFTLYEVLVVIIVIAVVAGLALPNFTGIRESSLGKEAKANLKVIAEAEKHYRLEHGSFYNSGAIVTDIDAINSELALALMNVTWDYTILATPDTFTAIADRKNTGGCSGGFFNCRYLIFYNINRLNNPEEPIASAACPR